MTTQQALTDAAEPTNEQIDKETQSFWGVAHWHVMAPAYREYARAILALHRPEQAEKGWQPIETAPTGREMFVVRGVNITVGDGVPYTTDPWCVWQDEPGKFARWPHRFAPTHWARIPAIDSTKEQG